MHLPSQCHGYVQHTFCACSAMADELGGPEVRALLCSLRQCSKVWPVWPMYTSGHDAQGTWYTTPGFCSGEIGSFGCTKSCLNVLCGLKQVRISTGVRILRIDSETCQHKITVVWDQLKFWYTLKWIVNLKDVKQKLLDVVNEQINCVQKLPDKVNSQYSTQH